MCRSIKPLFNFDPATAPDEVRAASLQFVRKVSGFQKPSRSNEQAFLRAVDAVTDAVTELLESLSTSAPPKNREEQAQKARARHLARP